VSFSIEMRISFFTSLHHHRVMLHFEHLIFQLHTS
jgi:hypothetical protein